MAEVGEALETLEPKGKENIPLPKTNRNHVFNDNFGVQYQNLKETMSGSFNPDGFVECIFYLCKYPISKSISIIVCHWFSVKHIFKAPEVFLRFYAAICTVAQNLVDLISRLIISRKLKSGLTQSNLAYLIKLLESKPIYYVKLLVNMSYISFP